MQPKNEMPPESPTAIALETGMSAPGLTDVRGPLEEALAVPAEQDLATPADDLDFVPGQSGAEGISCLPEANGRRPGRQT